MEKGSAVAESEDVFGVLEQEFALLARVLEANNRKRAYPLDRAPYLLLLRLADGPQSISALADMLLLDDSTVTRQVAAMQKRGLIKKVRNPADKRGALVERTAKGAGEVEAMRATRLQRIAVLFGDWPSRDREKLAELMGRANARLVANLRNEVD